MVGDTPSGIGLKGNKSKSGRGEPRIALIETRPNAVGANPDDIGAAIAGEIGDKARMLPSPIVICGAHARAPLYAWSNPMRHEPLSPVVIGTMASREQLP
jgi:hypothetical protein